MDKNEMTPSELVEFLKKHNIIAQCNKKGVEIFYNNAKNYFHVIPSIEGRFIVQRTKNDQILISTNVYVLKLSFLVGRPKSYFMFL